MKTKIQILFPDEISFKVQLERQQDFSTINFNPLINYLNSGFEFDLIMKLESEIYVDFSFAVGLNLNDLLEIDCLQSDTNIGRLFISCLAGQSKILKLCQKRYLDQETLELSFDWFKLEIIENTINRDLKIIKEKLEKISRR